MRMQNFFPREPYLKWKRDTTAYLKYDLTLVSNDVVHMIEF